MTDKVLFRHTFPKQPDTRQFSIILWARISDGTYGVHTEFENGERWQGSYFKSPAKALEYYNDKCATVMRFYLNPHGWEAMMEELEYE